MLKPIMTPIMKAIMSTYFGQMIAKRWAYNFDGVDDRGQFAFRAINPDGDIDIEFKTGDIVPPIGVARCIVDQSITTTFGAKEFYLQFNTSGRMQVVHGGNFLSSHTAASPLKSNTTYRMTLIGNVLTYFEDGIAQTINVTRGTAREPAAVTKIAAWSVGSSHSGYYSGQLLDIKINGVLYPLADRNQSIQLPLPTGLGAELITQSVLENPNFVGNQWSYLGQGRWQLNGNGQYNELIFIAPNLQPQSGYFEFEVESLTGVIRCYTATTEVGNLQSNPIVNTTGVFRHYVTSRAGVASGSYFSIVRSNAGQAASCIIKNISFKPLGTCNPLTLVNTTPDRWEEIEGTLPKTRFVYNFDGVDDRGQLATRAINPDGDIVIKWKQYDLQTTTYSRVVVSQQISSSVSSREFLLALGTGGQMVLQSGGASLTLGTGNLANGNYEFSLINNTVRLLRDGVEVVNSTFARGSAKEPTAVTVVGALTAGTVNTYGNWFAGKLLDLEINGVLWKMDEPYQEMQLPNPTGFGAELLINGQLSGATERNLPNWSRSATTLLSYSGLDLVLTNETTTPSVIWQTIDTVAGADYLVELIHTNGDAQVRFTVNDGVTNAYTGSIANSNFAFRPVARRTMFKAVSSKTTIAFYCNTGNLGGFVALSSVSLKAIGANSPLTLTNTTPDRWVEVLE